MKNWFKLSLLLLVAISLIGCAQKLSITKTKAYVLAGHTANGGYGVTQVTGKAAPNVQVYATATTSDVLNHTKTNQQGVFHLKALLAGCQYRFYTKKGHHKSKSIRYTTPKTPAKLQTKLSVMAPLKAQQRQVQANNNQAELRGRTSPGATVVLYNDAGASKAANTADFITSAKANKKGQFKLKANVHHQQSLHLKLYAYTAKQVASQYAYVTVVQ